MSELAPKVTVEWPMLSIVDVSPAVVGPNRSLAYCLFRVTVVVVDDLVTEVALLAVAFDALLVAFTFGGCCTTLLLASISRNSLALSETMLLVFLTV